MTIVELIALSRIRFLNVRFGVSFVLGSMVSSGHKPDRHFSATNSHSRPGAVGGGFQ